MAGFDKLLAKVNDLVWEELQNTGVQKTNVPGFFGFNVNEETLGSIGLNAGTKYGVRINPVIGVQNKKVEQALCDLLRQEFQRYGPGTIAIPLGYLMPQKIYRTWDFDEDMDQGRAVQDMVQAIRKYGFQFMQQHSSVKSVYETMIESRRVDRPLWLHRHIVGPLVYSWAPITMVFGRRRVHSPEARFVYRLPIACALLGKRDQGREIVEDELKSLGTATNPYADEYRRFAGGFLGRF